MTVVLFWKRKARLIVISVYILHFDCFKSWDEFVFTRSNFVRIRSMIHKIWNSFIAWLISGFAWTSFFITLILAISHFSLWTNHTTVVSWISCGSTAVGTRKSWVASLCWLHSLLTVLIGSLYQNIISFGNQLSHNNLFPGWFFSRLNNYFCCII